MSASSDEQDLDTRTSHGYSDNESLDDGMVAITPSIAESMFAYHRGRRYQARDVSSTSNILPNDEEELYRLALQHKSVVLSLGALHSVPVESFSRVLDAGCGPGWWAIDFADQHPECQVYGVDIVPIQPDMLPENLSFECDDICKGLRFPDNYFDMIHSRKLFSSLKEWPVYLNELKRVLKPGGYLNCIEVDIRPQCHPSTRGTALETWTLGLINVYKKSGMRSLAASELRYAMQDMDLCDIQEHAFLVPAGASPRKTAQGTQVAKLNTENTLLSMSALNEYYALANACDEQELELFLSEVRKDMANPALVWNGHWKSVVGRKRAD